MTLQERITADVTLAAKSGDDARRDTLRFLLAALHNREIEKRSASPKQGIAGGEGTEDPLTDEDVMAVVAREVKKRNEAIVFFEKGNRPEQAAKEKAELAVLEAYLPAALPEAEVEKLVDEAIRATGATSVKDIGKVMGAFRELAEKAAKSLPTGQAGLPAGRQGVRVDASAVGMKVKEKLGG